MKPPTNRPEWQRQRQRRHPHEGWARCALRGPPPHTRGAPRRPLPLNRPNAALIESATLQIRCERCRKAKKAQSQQREGGYGGSSFGGSRGGYGAPRTGGSGCYNCGQEGHMSRDCPTKSAGGGGGGARNCYNCGQVRSSAPLDRRSATPRACLSARVRRLLKAHVHPPPPPLPLMLVCAQDGHISRDCPSKSGGGGGAPRSGGGACYNCGQEGHLSRDCPAKSGGGGGGYGGSRGGSSYGGGRGGSRY